MAEQSLSSLEAVANDANRTCYEKYVAIEEATKNVETAEQEYQQAVNDLYNENDGKSMEEKQERSQKALEEMTAANAAVKEAETSFEASAESAQAATDAVAAKKEELRKSRFTDTSYVVYTARVECNFGMRESYLVLQNSHGVYTRQIEQMTVKDYVLDKNVVNFGGCKSKENPTLIKAAKEAVENANKKIESEKDWRDNIVDFFVKDQEVEVTDSLLEQCVGECIAEFPADTTWLKGHEKMTINGESPILRRCELTCNYGGRIIILLSGQPE